MSWGEGDEREWRRGGECGETVSELPCQVPSRLVTRYVVCACVLAADTMLMEICSHLMNEVPSVLFQSPVDDKVRFSARTITGGGCSNLCVRRVVRSGQMVGKPCITPRHPLNATAQFFPSYRRFIRSPMDLSTIVNRVASNYYRFYSTFHRDVMTVGRAGARWGW